PRTPAAEACSKPDALRAKCAPVTPGAVQPRNSSSAAVPFTDAYAAGVLFSNRGEETGEDPLPSHRHAHRSTPVTGPHPTARELDQRIQRTQLSGRSQGGGVQAGAGGATPCAPTRRQGIFTSHRTGRRPKTN